MNIRRLTLWGLLLWLVPSALADGLATAEQSFQAGIKAYAAGDFSTAARAFQESVGPAIQAWERALWLSPGDAAARENLEFARTTGQLEAPELTWYEEVSTWLPSGWWALLTAVSLWLVADLLALPGIFRRRRTGWQQALAALGLTLFLLTLPAHYGWHTRAKIGFVLEANLPLRCERTLGGYCFVRFRNAAGWLRREEFGLVADR
jgi:hypothetical protein